MKLTQRWYAAALLSTTLAWITGCRRPDLAAYYFPRLRVDSTLHAWPEGPRSLMRPPAAGEMYFVFHGSVLDSIDDLKLAAGAVPQQRLYMEAKHGESLYRVEKADQMAQGSYGVLLVRRKCFFRPKYRNSVAAEVSFSDPNREPEHPEVLTAAPDQAPPITSFSLVRVYENVPSDQVLAISRDVGLYPLQGEKPDGFVLIADYEASGTLSGFAFSKSQSGHRSGASSRSGTSEDVSLSSRFGIPRFLDLQKYSRNSKLPEPNAVTVPGRSLGLLIFGFGKLIRQDELKANALVASRWLRPSVTDEQKAIDPPCDAQFRKQQATGQSTTW